jgi:hypothetical protein
MKYIFFTKHLLLRKFKLGRGLKPLSCVFAETALGKPCLTGMGYNIFWGSDE